MARSGIGGFDDLMKGLKTLGGKVERKVLRQAVNASATPVLNTARQHVEEQSEDTGALGRSLIKKVKTSRDKQTVTAIVGPSTDAEEIIDGELKRPARYAHLVENGHIDENGNHVPAQPFLRPAMDENRDKSLGIIKDKLVTGIVREAQKR